MQNLFRKHQVESAAELLHLQNELEIKLQQSQNIDDEIISLKNEVKKAKENAFIMAQKLSESRLNASKLLADFSAMRSSVAKWLNPNLYRSGKVFTSPASTS